MFNYTDAQSTRNHTPASLQNTTPKSFQRHIFDLIEHAGGSAQRATIDRTLCRLMESLEGGVFLSQVVFWSDKSKGEWFYKSHRDWYEELFLSEYQVRQATQKCVVFGFLEIKLQKVKGAPTVHYRLKVKEFCNWLLKNLGMESEKFQKPNERVESEVFQIPLTENYKDKETEKKGELINSPTSQAPVGDPRPKTPEPEPTPATAPMAYDPPRAITATAPLPPCSAAPPPPASPPAANPAKSKRLPAQVVDKGLKLLTHEEIGLPETEAMKLIRLAGGDFDRLLLHVGGWLKARAEKSPYATHEGLFSRVQNKFNERPFEKLPSQVTSNPVFSGVGEMPRAKYSVDPKSFDRQRPKYSLAS